MKILFTTIVAAAAVTISFAQNPRVYTAPLYDSTFHAPGLYPDRIILNVAEDPKTEMNVTWRTSKEVTNSIAEIAVAEAAPKFWRNAVSLKATTEKLSIKPVGEMKVEANYHSVKFTKLKPGTKYAYRVGDGQRWSEWFHFDTAPEGKDKKFSFLYVGDAQNYILELWSRLIREGFKKTPDASFIVHAGDLINSAHNDQQWHEWFLAGGFIHGMIPSVPTPGNHEQRPITAEQEAKKERQLSVQWKPQYSLPQNGPKGLEETVYYFDYQNTRIISLNSNNNLEEQVPWLENVLKNNKQKWVIVTYHHPLYSASEGRDNEKLRKLWKPVFDKYKVDLALQGHDHSYARGRVSPFENVMDGVNLHDKTGTVYVVSVSGGKMYNLKPDWEIYKTEAERQRVGENTQLFQTITVDGDRLSFEAYTATGELYDAFDLIKNGDKPNIFHERRMEAVPEYYHHNTTHYHDKLPPEYEKAILAKYTGYVLDGVNIGVQDSKIFYAVKIEKGDVEKMLRVDEKGNITERK